MVRRGRIGLLAAAFIAATATLAIASATASAQSIIAFDDFYVASNTTMNQGQQPNFQNAGNNQHNVTARGLGPDGKPLFSSPTIGSGNTLVRGSQFLTTGTYPFFCTIHPTTMQANLTVSGAGTPTPRPDIEVTIRKISLGKLVDKGRLPVTVQALTKSDDVSLELKLGKTTISRKAGLDLDAAEVARLALEVSQKVRSRIADRAKARLRLTGTVDFGSPDFVIRVLSFR